MIYGLESDFFKRWGGGKRVRGYDCVLGFIANGYIVRGGKAINGPNRFSLKNKSEGEGYSAYSGISSTILQ